MSVITTDEMLDEIAKFVETQDYCRFHFGINKAGIVTSGEWFATLEGAHGMYYQGHHPSAAISLIKLIQFIRADKRLPSHRPFS